VRVAKCVRVCFFESRQPVGVPIMLLTRLLTWLAVVVLATYDAAATRVVYSDGVGASFVPERVGQWPTMTPSAVNYHPFPPGLARGSDQYLGGVSNGTHLILAPNQDGRIATLRFGDDNMTALPPLTEPSPYPANAFLGMVYDGVDVWFVPHEANVTILRMRPDGSIASLSWPPAYVPPSRAFATGTSTVRRPSTLL
jgi:hypothetical protein